MDRLQPILRWAGVTAGLVLAVTLVVGHGARAQAPAAAAQKPGAPPADAGPALTAAKVVLEGGDADDRLAGTDADEWLLGGKGNDTLLGGRGRDAIDAGDGEDTIDGGPD